MIRPLAGGARVRSGITLTEILISILIMGIGMISLATLFPLGLTRIRKAAQQNRSGLLFETIAADTQVRNLVAKQSFLTTWYGSSSLNIPYDPMTQDPGSPLNAALGGGLSVTAGPGLTFCYDPLWRSVTTKAPLTSLITNQDSNEYRFANGQGFLRLDPDGNPASGHGLQRITNLPVSNLWPPIGATTVGSIQYNEWQALVGNIFASQDDPVFQVFSASPNPSQGRGSPLVTDLSTGAPLNDWSYTWMFTGRQSDVSDPSNYEGDIVVHQNRPFGVNSVGTVPFSNSFTPTNVATGETVVEAVWGYFSPPIYANGTGTPYPSVTFGDPSPFNRTVLLRWPASQPDPDVRVGGWIADVTYERVLTTWASRFAATPYSGQRCIWYRVAKKTSAEAETGGNLFDSSGIAYRSMVVTVATPLRAKTILVSPPPSGKAAYGPQHVNAALIAPSVVNVFSQVFYTH